MLQKTAENILLTDIPTFSYKYLDEEQINNIFSLHDNTTEIDIYNKFYFSIINKIINQENIDILDYLLEEYTDLIDDNILNNIIYLSITYLLNSNKLEIADLLLNKINDKFKSKIIKDSETKIICEYLRAKINLAQAIENLLLEVEKPSKDCNPSIIKELTVKLQTNEKDLVQNFSSIQSVHIFCDDIDNKRLKSEIAFLESRFKLLRLSKGDKNKGIMILIQEIQSIVNRKITLYETRISKLAEILSTRQSKIMLNISRLKNPDLNKAFQLYMRLKLEVFKNEDRMNELLNLNNNDTKTSNLIFDIQRNLIETIKKMEEHLKIIEKKSDSDLNKEFKDLQFIEEEYYELKNKLAEIKNIIKIKLESAMDYLDLINRLKDLAENKSFYRTDKTDYLTIKSFILSLNKNAINFSLSLRSCTSIPLTILPDNITIYGRAFFTLTKVNNSVILRVNGYSGRDFNSVVGIDQEPNADSLSFFSQYTFQDMNSAINFILCSQKISLNINK
ncbi:MAG: hypothetical protein H7263_05015 [Candidatus Sericytochromatia bacterium]|nr:hypothetical protein [Candidatus Sericytochromatia bacterium]